MKKEKPFHIEMGTMKKLTILFLALATFSCNNPPDKATNNKSTETTNPVEKSETEKSKTVNEVIHDTVTTNDTQDFTYSPKETKRIAKSPDTFIGFSKFYSQFDKPTQTFTLKPNEDKTITCKEGTNITIKSNSFVTESGKSVKGDIKLKVKEYYKTSDMLLANLTTTSNNEILETGGMLHIEAFSAGEKCQLRQGSKIELSFPTKNKKDDMQLFSGSWTTDRINWNLQEINTEENKESTAYTFVETMPEFPGGQQQLWEYISSNIKYPSSAMENGIQGTVYVGFIVSENGETENIQVLRGVDPSLNQAAISVVEQMPKWTPGKQRGEFVKVSMTIPLSFTLGGADFNTNNIEYAKEFEEQVNADNLSETSMSEVSQYLFSASKLGWINCDRFYRDNSPKVDYLVNIGTSKHVDIKIVFNNINSILTGSTRNNKYIFNNVPTGHTVTLVALKYENDQYYLAIKKTKISGYEEPSLDFEPVTMAKLKTEMEKLNRI